MKLKVSETQFLEYRYEIKPNEYMVDFTIRSQGLSGIINSSNPINLDWKLKAYRNEKSMRTENMYTYYYYKADNEVDWLSPTDNDVVNNVKWAAFKQHFFTSVLISDKSLNNVAMS